MAWVQDRFVCGLSTVRLHRLQSSVRRLRCGRRRFKVMWKLIEWRLVGDLIVKDGPPFVVEENNAK